MDNCIDNLPNSALTHVASFLAVPSRALFAVAISTVRNELTNADGLSIVGSQSDILDFGEIHEDLAAKLTDDHIRDVLLCVDAVNRVTRLMLTGCIKITAAGLEPLRGSMVIEQIDFSAIETSDSDYILLILDSIIEQERCALKHLKFPRKTSWCSRASPFQQFIMRYNQMWAQRQDELVCFKCRASLPQRVRVMDGQWVQDVGGPWIQRGGNQFGADQHTCYECLKHYCRNCDSESGGKMVDYCGQCNRIYCADCAPILQCDGCFELKCSGCANFDTCPDCGSFCCDSCSCSCGFFCYNYNCNTNQDDRPHTCDECQERLCGSCRRQVRILRCVPPPDDDDDGDHDDCEVLYICSNCAPKEQICGDCGSFCCGVHRFPCESCGFFCHHCSGGNEACVTCEECNERLCSGCRSQSGSKGIKRCSSCPREYCNGCRVRHLSESHSRYQDCIECDGLANIHLLEEKIGGLANMNKELTDTNKELTDTNKELTDKNKELADKNKELTDKNEQLRSKMKTIRKIEGKTEQHE